MPKHNLTPVASTVLQEIFSALHLPGAVTINQAVITALEKRRREAINVLITELHKGGLDAMQFSQEEADEFVQILLRFRDAVEKGTARDNLRFLAQVVVGAKRKQALTFDKFQKWANILESLTRDEILLLGTVICVVKARGPNDGFWSQLLLEAAPIFMTEDKTESLSAALTRTGLILPASGYGKLVYGPNTPDLIELSELADLELSA